MGEDGLWGIELGYFASLTENRNAITHLDCLVDVVGDKDDGLLELLLQALLDRHEATTEGPRRLWRIPAAFSPAFAPQLNEAAALAGLTPEQAVAQIEAAKVRVIAIGFAPGQPYLGMLPDDWDIPRQSELTKSLPPGALITAVRQLIIWAADAPTGWRHIGQTAFRVYLPETATPFAFEPGDAVQFQSVSDTDYRAIAANTDTNGGATCEVLR